MAINPFLHRIPAELQEDYKEDFRAASRPGIDYVPTASGACFNYDILLIRARKD
jgi:hypothetical protein